ncbi:MAG: glycerophosphodiester phosphodiesterase family protein [Methanophagales archaeon]|nr:glycerophosphodiester phosphodiesterase family protein [Methanophagales archaeon]MCW3140041.1 glycerophosphodiester phosphodiesterase family protein [Methanophagales archaeon]
MKIIAHRGARASEPENTVRAMNKAFECGADAVEVDLRFTCDHKLVVIHDDTLERTTNGTGKVSDMTLEQLRALDAGKGERIPELSEALSVAKRYLRPLIIELKEEGMEWQVLEEVTEVGLGDKVIISSFIHTSLRNLKEKAPEIKTGVIIASVPVNPVRLVQDAKADIIFAKYSRITREFIDACVGYEGIEVYLWTVNTIDDLNNAISYGVDGVVTDNPCELIRMSMSMSAGA